jgi:hypothetical protein
MVRQRHHEHGHKVKTDKAMFPKKPLGPILGAPKQYEPLGQDYPRSCGGGERVNSNDLIFDDDDRTKKVRY